MIFRRNTESPFVLFFIFFLFFLETSLAKASSELSYKKLIEYLRNPSGVSTVSIKIGKQSYSITVNNPQVGNLIRDPYSKVELEKLSEFLKPVLQIRVSPRGIVQAADRPGREQFDPTNYNAVWVRDSLWVYLALRTTPELQPEAKKVILSLLDYTSSPAQAQRFLSLIKDPSKLTSPDAQMEVPHIRFDGRSPTFDDVHVEGLPQRWNHKQNDALGLLFDQVLQAVRTGLLADSDLKNSHYQSLAYFPAYFSSIRFFDMEDAGSWEEIERVNSSSVGLVISGLECLQAMIRSSDPRIKNFVERIRTATKEPKILSEMTDKALAKLIDKGYQRLFRQLKSGGESPIYPKKSARYRTSDIALLNLIYPANLRRLEKKHKEMILNSVQPLIGQVGIRRYLGDSYQSGNYWFMPEQGGTGITSLEPKITKKTDDTSSAQDFLERGSRFITDSEAQWFFDSWYSKIMGLMFRAYKEGRYRSEQRRFFNRSLGQITGGTAEKPQLGADGTSIPPLANPESYNIIANGKERFFASSPIVPLNWAKASLMIALQELRDNP